MEQTKALNALEPFLALSKSATSPRAAADLVIRATSNPNTYFFAELLDSPQIQALKDSPEFQTHLRLLEIFSYGTYADYQEQKSTSSSIPELNDAQTLKLRQLTLLTMARSRRNLAYPVLQQALFLPDARSLEALVTSAIYAGLLSATLDPARQHVHVTALSPLRDLKPGVVPTLSSALAAWSDRCASTLIDIESEMARIRATAVARQRESFAREQLLAALVEDAEKKGPHGPHGPHSNMINHEGAILGDRTRRPASRGMGRPQRSAAAARGLNKRGSNVMQGAGELDDEAMDVDLEEGEQKRAPKRKL